MVDERITDGKRIAQLLASEITGRETGVLADLSVVDADPDAEPTDDGAFAYGVAVGEDRLAEVFVQPDRAYLELQAGLDAATDTADDEGLRVRPKAVEPPRTLVFVESGAEVKGAVEVVLAAGERYRA
ncbi:hypothetical protein [Halorientalis salina]|uniref:hypothetical protein n=1 Tax=Halorientalis salina TaxID=2932266 RepID=UPI0010ABB6EA|nr:hypothetical protein [Halorientalis salina]